MKLGLKQISSNRITEKEYRNIKSAINYSAIKLFDKSREQFYNEIILGNPRRDKPSVAKTMGSMIHSLLAGEEGMFDHKFQLLQGRELSPTTHMYTLVENLYERSLQSMDENGMQKDKFEVIFEDAVQRTKYDYNGNEVMFKKKSTEQILTLFQEQGEDVYQQKLAATGKTVVSAQQIEQAEKLVEKLKAHPYTREYANAETTDETTVFNELPILCTIHGIEYKGMPDRMIIDHSKKIVKTIDWKSAHSVDEAAYNGGVVGQYLSYGYYIQAALYKLLIEYWCKEHGMEDYTIEPMTFIYVDTRGFMDPVVLPLSQDDIDRAWRGFSVAGRIYNGLSNILAEIAWASETGIWTTTKEHHENNGVTRINIRYGSR